MSIATSAGSAGVVVTKMVVIGVIFDSWWMWIQHNISMQYHSRTICTKFLADLTLKYQKLWRQGGHLGIYFENESCINITQDIHISNIKFRQDRTIFEQVWILVGNAFYVWRLSCHFENSRTLNLKREYLKTKLNLLVNTPRLYHFSVGGVCGGHLGRAS